MAPYQLITVLIFRLLIPTLLGLCATMRFSMTSFAYFIMLLIGPWLPSPNVKTMTGHTGRYLKALVIISVVNFLMQFIFQMVLVSLPPYASFLDKCELKEKLLRQVGLVRFDAITEEDGTRWILPDCLMIVFGPGSYIAIHKLILMNAAHHALTITDPSSLTLTSPPPPPYRDIFLRILNTTGSYLALILLGLAGIMVPSMTSSVYFFVFLGGATYWSLNNTLGRKFALICRGMTVLAGVHVTLLYMYQMQFMQNALHPKSVTARVLGFTALQEVHCEGDPRTFHKATEEWSRFVNPLVLFFLYYFLIFQVHFVISNKAALLTKPANTGVRYLIRRTTVRRRSKKSQKSNTQSSTTSGKLPKGLSILSLTSPTSKHFRKGSAISARSAPIPNNKPPNSLNYGRRQSVFSDISHHPYNRHLYHPCHPPPHFNHLLNNQRQLHHNFHHQPSLILHENGTGTTPPVSQNHRRSLSTVSSVLNSSNFYPSDRTIDHVSTDAVFKSQNQATDSETPLSPFHTFSITSEMSFSVPQSASSSHRSSYNRSRFPFSNFNSFSRPSSNTSSLLRRKASVKSVQFPIQLNERNDKRNSLQVPNTTTINEEEREEVTSAGVAGDPLKNLQERPSSDDSDSDDDEHPLQRLIAPLITIFQLIIRSSYIATNIVMMAWSITYHSWLTFVLLLWACVLWMIPNQRAAMLRCSPFLVVYAELLLVLQYIYCMDLTDEELPSEVDAVNLGQVGLLKYPVHPVKPLIVKVLYTGMFWVTLRQYVQEVLVSETIEMSTAAALRPFTVAVTTTTSGHPLSSQSPDDDSTETSPIMHKFGQWVRGLLVKFWIWLVAINLFVFGIHGSEIVIFKIMYMVFFLVFLITFQVSYSAWRKFLYGFWLTIITYQMIVLVLTYTYQFDNFPHYWENYTGIPIQLQNDIGLEVYDTGRLFVKLMTPTFFVIVTIIQVHYFHEGFLELADIEKKSEPSIEEKKAPKESKKETVLTFPNLLDSCTLDDLKDMVLFIVQKVTSRLRTFLHAANELTWRFLEIHINKIVLGSVMLLACYDVCALHWIFALLSAVAIPLSDRVQTMICRACVVIVSFLLIARMIYQIEYIDKQGIAANCSEKYPNSSWPLYPLNKTANTAEWLGLKKVKSLTKYLKGYIGITVVITIQAVVVIRQEYNRLTTGYSPPPSGILFPNITRAVADDGLNECIKYLFNYGFFKFGLEICLICLVGVIGTRLDFYSMFYTGWLCYFFNRRREEIYKVWKWFIITVTSAIPLQYLMCVGMPPTVCLDYPWAAQNELREWLFFPDFVKPPESYKIVTDFGLLIFAVCQQKAFDVEFSENAESYEGGSNREIVYDDMTNLVNPIPDFVTYNRTYLDKIKVVIFFSFYWVTLAVMFLSGTNRTTLFAMGYVLCAFAFLWQGNEFYLRPLSNILKLWNVLLGYNVVVIVVKTFLQLLGCVVLEHLANNACWFVQLLSIACVKKFGDKSDDELVAKLVDVCAVPKSEAGLLWDGVCFGFLLMQRRLFSSFYFQHLVTEMKAQTELASRGAELIAELMQKEIAEQQAAAREVIRKIKEKMEQIKATQRKMSKTDLGELPQDHYDANTLEQFSNASSPLPLELNTPSIGNSRRDMRNSPRGGQATLSTTPGGGAPTPSSANMTLSLDGYLEPNYRVCLSTSYIPLQQPITSPSDESFPVFSPPPYNAIKERNGLRMTSSIYRRESEIGPPWLRDQLRDELECHRPSNASPAISHHTSLVSNLNREPTTDSVARCRWKIPRSSSVSEITKHVSESFPLNCRKDEHHRRSFPSQISRPDCARDFVSEKAIRSGDYYMFEDYDDNSILPIDASTTTTIPDEDDPQGFTISELLSTARKTDIENAVEEARLARMSESDFAISSRRSSFKVKPFQRTYSGKSQLSGRSAFSMISKNSRNVRIHEHPKSPHLAPALPTEPAPPRRSSLSRPPPPTSLPPLPPLPPNGPQAPGDGSFFGDDSAMHDYSEIEPQEPRGLAPILRKFVRWFNFGWELFESLMISVTLQLNRLSKDYRYVSACLSDEKRQLKETEGFSAIPVAPTIINSSQPDWPTLPLENICEKISADVEKSATNKIKKTINKVQEKDQTKQSLENISDSKTKEQSSHETSEEDRSDNSVDCKKVIPDDKNQGLQEQRTGIKFMVSVWYAIISRSELVSYIMIFVNMIKSASILALPLPFMVFLWGSLSVPRPSKTFWISIIAYTEVIVMIKCLFQFDFFPWNQEERLNAPFWAPRIIGVEKKDRYAVYDLALLLVVFFHRFMLKSLGLWKKSEDGDESTTVSEDAEDRASILSQHSLEHSPQDSIKSPKPSLDRSPRLSLQPSPRRSTEHISHPSLEQLPQQTALVQSPTHSSSSSSSSTSSSSTTKQKDDSSSKASLLSQLSEDSTDVTFTKQSSVTSYTKDSSIMTTMRESALSQSKDSTITPGSESGSIMLGDRPPLQVSDVHYTLPYLESSLDELLLLDREEETIHDSKSDIPSFSTFEPSNASSRRSPISQIYASPVQENEPYSSSASGQDRFRTLSHPSLASYQEPFSTRNKLAHTRNASNLSSQSHMPRKSSLMVVPGHRRQLSAGSRVSFQECNVSPTNRRPSAYHRRQSLASHSVYSDMASSDSLPINCHKIAEQFQKLRNIRKPTKEEVREALYKFPYLVKNNVIIGFNEVKRFLNDVLHPKYQLSVNVYTYMFICDFFNFFLLIFGFSAFGTQQGDGGVKAYLEDNRVPIPFLIMLMLQFALIIIDRALFLKKYILGKLFYQVALTFGIHIWMFFILPAFTEREFNAKRPPQFFYMIKCLYLLLAAYQIRSGYPTRILGNFFCKDYNLINNGSFRVFMYVPFLYELRVLMDWIWTNTSMNLSDWIKMEDIFVRIFMLKCERRQELEYPQGRGAGRRKLFKYGMGGCALFGVISLIWFPLVLFALSSTVGLPNPPVEVTLEITIGPYQPVFKMKATQQDIYPFNLKEWDDFNYHYRTDKTAQTFLSNYDYGDVVVLELNGNSTSVWGISPPAQTSMIDDLLSNHSLKIFEEWSIKRVSESGGTIPISHGTKELNVDAFNKDGKRNEARQRLANVLSGHLELNPVTISDLFPKFLKVTNKGESKYVDQLASEKDGFIDLNFSLQSDVFANLSAKQEWWEVEEDCSKGIFSWLPRDKKCRYLTIYTFNDKAFPEGLSFISGGGIVGMYSTMVLLVSKMLRPHFSGVSATIMFDDMPNVDRLLQLCLDIYLVRESGELELEEDLFSKLIFLFRSPETLIKWTRPPEEDSPEDEDMPPQIEN